MHYQGSKRKLSYRIALIHQSWKGQPRGLIAAFSYSNPQEGGPPILAASGEEDLKSGRTQDCGTCGCPEDGVDGSLQRFARALSPYVVVHSAMLG